MAASDHGQEPLAWLKTNSLQNPGLLFFGAVLEYLAESEGRYLLAERDWDTEQERKLDRIRKKRGESNTIGPETDAQVAAYNAFCQAVRDALQHSTTDHTEYDTGAVGQGNRELDSFTGPLLEGLLSGDIKSALKLWLSKPYLCDGGYGKEPDVRSFLRKCRDANTATLRQDNDKDENENAYNAVAIVSYRCAMARVADDLLDCIGMQRPSDGGMGGMSEMSKMSCLLWDRDVWQHGVAREFNVPVEEVAAMANFVITQLYQDPESYFLPAMIRPAPEQGPIFWRPVQYIIAAAVEDTLRRRVERADDGLEPESAYQTKNYLADTAGLILIQCQLGIEISKEIAQKCPKVRRLGRKWAKTMRM